MAKQAKPRRLADNEAKATLRVARTSAQKARLPLDMIRGKGVEKALADLTFSTKKASKLAKDVLLSAIANAENNHDLNVDKLYVAKAYADRSFVMKRFRARARGRVGRILKPTCHMTIVVAEKQSQVKEG